MTTSSQFKQQKGATLIVVLLLLLVIMLLALSIATSTTSRSLIVNNNVLKAQATEAAETGSDVLLRLLKEGKVEKDNISECTKSYNEQFKGDGSQNTIIASSDGDRRSVTLSWYVCKPATAENTDMCTESTVTDCFSVVITGVACFGNITDPTNDACTVSRYLQGYAFKK